MISRLQYASASAALWSVCRDHYFQIPLEHKFTPPCIQLSPDSSPGFALSTPCHVPHLWEFLASLLKDPDKYSSSIAWTGNNLEFKLYDPVEVSRLWGIKKNRPAMNYEKLSRSLRAYYDKGIMEKVSGN